MTCWTCHAASFDECEKNGHLRTCLENEVNFLTFVPIFF